MSDLSPADLEKRAAAERAVEFVRDGMRIGLGTGSTASFAVKALGAKVRAGMRIQGVPTSEATRRLAESEGIPLLTFDDAQRLDLCIDGADEADRNLCLIKGGGGALLREKVVAFASARFLVVMDSKKLVERLGVFPLPVEVIPFAWRVVAREIESLGGAPALRKRDGVTMVTDNGNWILDCAFGAISDPPALARRLSGIPGIAEHGLFVGMATELIVGRGSGTEILTARK